MHAMAMKRIALKILGSDKEPIEIILMPEVTVGDILADLNLKREGEVVCLSNHDRYFADEEVIFDKVTDEDKLWVTYPCVYGRCAG
jgi:hypothetical protein